MVLIQTDTLNKTLTPYIRPPFLQKGDTVAVVAVSSKLPRRPDTSFVRRIEAWGSRLKWANICTVEMPDGLRVLMSSGPRICSGLLTIRVSKQLFLQRRIRCSSDLGLSRLVGTANPS